MCKRGAAVVASASVLLWCGAAEAGEPRVGVAADYRETFMSYRSKAANMDVTDHYDTIGVSAVADAGVVRLSLGYASQIGAMIRFADGAEERLEGFQVSYLHAVAVGKLPFDLIEARWSLWPALGLRFDYNLRYEYDGAKPADVNEAPHDASIVGGVGTDYELGPSTSFTASLLAGYDLTPSLGPSVSEDASGIAVTLSVGVLLGL